MDSFSFSFKVSMASPVIMWKMAAELCRKPAKPWPRNLRRSNAQVAAWLHKTCIVSSRFKMFQSWSLFQDTSRRPNCHCSGVDIIFPQRHSQLAAWALPFRFVAWSAVADFSNHTVQWHHATAPANTSLELFNILKQIVLLMKSPLKDDIRNIAIQ